MKIHDNRQPPGWERALDPLVRAKDVGKSYGLVAAIFIALVILTPAWIGLVGWLVLSLFLWLLG
jgi:hypothetical protein